MKSPTAEGWDPRVKELMEAAVTLPSPDCLLKSAVRVYEMEGVGSPDAAACVVLQMVERLFFGPQTQESEESDAD